MSTSQDQRVEQLFLDSLELEPGARAEFLDEACGGDARLRADVEALLTAAGDSEQFFANLSNRLGAAAFLGEADCAAQTPVGPGSSIGAYRLVRELGSGGMATVWLAERIDGLINRPVALKFPHGAWRMAGLAERMAQERQFLATLAHPNIARLYDAGLTGDGQPYLALEYVEGVPIDRYCRENVLPVRERLRLFIHVARAVAHAHSRLIVHRDLKPSNVMVTAAGEVRLLDFGIARLVADSNAEATRLTALSGRALTIDYASPEQILGQPISTASDIYSLGVLLFEMMTGVLPYRLNRESRGALEDAILGADAPLASSLAPAPLRRELRGDVDTIIRKALRKKPEERYATVDAFIEDIDRHRSSRPVLARPDSVWYRFSRLVGRNRIAFAAGAVVAIAILAGTTAALLQGRAAERERQRAQDINAFITSVLQRTDPYHDAGAALSGAQLLLLAREDLAERFPDHPDRRIELLNIIGAGLIGLADLTEAERTLQRALAEARAAFGGADAYSLQAQVLLAEIKSVRRDAAGAREALRLLLPAARGLQETNPEILVRALKLQTDVAIELGEYENLRASAGEAVSVAKARLGSDHPLTEAVAVLLAETYVYDPQSDAEALRAIEAILDEMRALHPLRPDHPQILRLREIRARMLDSTDRREAAREQSEVVEALKRVVGPRTLEVANVLSGLAHTEMTLGEFHQSLAHSDEALGILAERVDRKSADYAYALLHRGRTRLIARQAAGALGDFEETRQIFEVLFGPAHLLTQTAHFNRALALARLGRQTEARGALSQALAPNPPPRYAGWWEAYTAGSVLRLVGDARAAVRALDAALPLVEAGTNRRRDRLRVLAELGLAQFALEERESARRNVAQALALNEEDLQPMSPFLADVLVAQGALMIEGNADEAIGLLRRADEYWRDFDARNSDGGEAAYWLAMCHAKRGDEKASGASMARAVKLLSASPLPRAQVLLRLARQRKA